MGLNKLIDPVKLVVCNKQNLLVSWCDCALPAYAECFGGSNWRHTRTVALLNSPQQFILVSLVSNSTYFFIMAGMSLDMSLTINQIGVG